MRNSRLFEITDGFGSLRIAVVEVHNCNGHRRSPRLTLLCYRATTLPSKSRLTSTDFPSLTAVPCQTTNVESLIGLSCQVTGEIEYFTGGRRSPAKTVSGTISRFSQIDVTWLYLNVVMQKKNPCAGGSAGFHLSTVFGPLRSRRLSVHALINWIIPPLSFSSGRRQQNCRRETHFQERR